MFSKHLLNRFTLKTGSNLLNPSFYSISKLNFSQIQKQRGNHEVRVNRDVSHEETLMSSSEAFVESLINQNVTDVFGIVGSAFMDALDIFPEAGIRFIPVQHEQNAVHMADGYSRISGKHGVCIAQNGPGITNFVTGLGAAYWAHSPVVAITPEAGTMTKGLGGFQEADQLPIFSTVVKYQANVNNPNRISELTNRAFDYAMYERGPTQINIPRDYFYHEGKYKINKPIRLKYPSGNIEDLQEAVNLISSAKNPCILAGGGVIMSKNDCISSLKRLSELLNIPVATTYLHNDSFPCNHENSVGPLGYQGSKAAMNSINNADLIIAIGTRLSPFGTLPQYGFDYWPKNAKIIQCDIDSRRLGLVKNADVYIQGDSGLVTQQLYEMLQNNRSSIECLTNKDLLNTRISNIQKYKQDWTNELNNMTYNDDDVRIEGLVKPRRALEKLQRYMPENAIVSTDIGNICSVSNSYLNFSSELPSFLAAMTFGNCQYAFSTSLGAKIAAPDRPVLSYQGDGAWGMSLNEFLTCTRENIPVTAVVFNNQQWGAEKKNQVLWFGDRYIGVNLDNNNWSYADIARSMNGHGIRITHEDEIEDGLNEALSLQMKDGKASVIEIMCTRELGDPFRRDAMKLPQRHLKKYQSTNEFEESPTGQPVDMQS